MSKKILFIASYSRSLINFRKDLILEFKKNGYQIIAFAPDNERETIHELKKMDVKYFKIPLERRGFNPFKDLHTLIHLINRIKEESPDIVLSYTIKPIIYGSIASSITKRKKIFSIITGIGYGLYNDTFKQKILGMITKILYKVALRNNSKVFFQNPDDLNYFKEKNLIQTKTAIINGSGVDISYFKYSNPPVKPVTFLLVARLLKEKGIIEYLEAAKKIKNSYPNSKFQIIGWIDNGPSSIKLSTIKNFEKESNVEFLGYKKDIRPYLKKVSVYVLPSYREGTPRTVLEAMSVGRPIITSDAPGCRETVINGKNGYLVPIKDSESLAEKMKIFILNPSLIKKMGLESRKLAEEKYNVLKVNKSIINEMEI